MDLSTEKTTLIKQLEKVNDLSLIIALKKLLEYGTEKISDKDDVLLEASIQNGLEDIKNRMVKPHAQVMTKMRARYLQQMTYHILWSNEAEITFENNLVYLEKEWSPSTILKFIDRTDDILNKISSNPKLFPYHKKKKTFINVS